MSLTDRLGRPLRNLRLSVTDRCNLRCEYCMPETDYVWLPREDVLHFEEISALVDVFISHGVTKVRLTGGEPLLRRDLATLVRLLAAKPGLEDLALTTNGTLLREQARELKEAGLGRLTVSLDTLRPDRFKTLTRFDELARVQDGIDAAREIFGRAGDPHPSGEAESLRSRPSDVNALPASGTRAPNPAREAESLRSRPSNVNALPASGTRAPNPAREAESLRSRPSNVNALPASGGGAPRAVKIDTVVIRGVNDDELIDLLEYARAMRAELRFIEYMDVGGATRWTAERVVPRSEMLEILTRQYGTIEPIAETTSAPAERFALPDGTTFGIIASTTEPFCRSCDRSRLTADGLWFLCLYGTRGIDLRGPLRQGASASEIGRLISAEWAGRVDRGAEERLALGERRAFVPITSLRRDPHLEMHTRGG